MTTQHTPTPWILEDNGSDVYTITDDDLEFIATLNVGREYDARTVDLRGAVNAEFIVKACNAHDANVARIAELEAALRGLLEQGEKVNAWSGPATCKTPAVVAARAALAKVTK